MSDITDRQPGDHDDGFRMAALSDGAFAIVITLLAVEIHRPDAEPGWLGAELVHNWPYYAAYVLGFLYVGIIWLNHHELFKQLHRIDHTLIWINFGILGTAALMPFPTGVLASAFQSGTLEDQRIAVVLYSTIAGLMSLAWLPLFPYLHRQRHLAHAHVAERHFRNQYSRPIIGVISYIAAGLIGWFVSPWIAIAIFGWMVVYHAWTSRGTPGDIRGKSDTQSATPTGESG